MSNSTNVSSARKVGSSYAWLVLLVTYIASFVAPMNQFKVPPVAGMLIPEFMMDSATFGLLMSALTIIGVILAFPTLFIVRKLGLKNTVLTSLGCLGLGSLIGVLPSALGANSFEALFIGRMIEGIGMGLVGVSAPSAISVWFDKDKRGLALGLWATWVPIALTLMFAVGPAIAGEYGWQSLWWICVVASVVAFILFAIVFKLPSTDAEEEVVIKATPSECLKVLKNRNIWLLGICFFVFAFVGTGIFTNFYNQYLANIWGFDDQSASSFVSIATIICLFGVPLIGFFSDKIGKRKPILAVGFFLLLAASIIWWFAGGNIALVITTVIITGIALSVSSSPNRAMAPEVMQASALGATMSMVVLQFFQNLGPTISSPLFGALLDSFGGAAVESAWMYAGLAVCVPCAIIGIICAILVKSR